MKGGGASPHGAPAPKSGVWGGSPNRDQNIPALTERPRPHSRRTAGMPEERGQEPPQQGGRAQAQRARTQGASPSAGRAHRGAPAGARSADDENEESAWAQPDRERRGEPRGDGSPSGARKKNTPRGRGRLGECGRKAADGKRPPPTGDTNAPRERSDRSRDRRERGEGNPRAQRGGDPSSLFGGREQAPDRPPRRGEKRSAAPPQGRKTQPANLTKRARASGNEPTTPQGAIKPTRPKKPPTRPTSPTQRGAA